MKIKNLVKFIGVNLLPESLFDAQMPMAVSKRLFSAFVNVVDIENHSFCNRICSFCPNSTLDRHSSVTVQSPTIFHKIIDDLASINYSENLVWARYSESLAHESIIERIAFARKMLPRATLTIISNGDYLDRNMLKKLELTGLDKLNISLYLKEGKERDGKQIQLSLDNFCKRTGLVTSKTRNPFIYTMKDSSIAIRLDVCQYNFPYLSNRGGLIRHPGFEKYNRRSICLAPLHTLTIDYNGLAVLCCHVRSDAPEHKDCIIGDLNDEGYGLFDLYRDLASAREMLLSHASKHGVCQKCTVCADVPECVARYEKFASLLSILPGLSSAFQKIYKAAMHKSRFTLNARQRYGIDLN